MSIFKKKPKPTIHYFANSVTDLNTQNLIVTGNCGIEIKMKELHLGTPGFEFTLFMSKVTCDKCNPILKYKPTTISETQFYSLR